MSTLTDDQIRQQVLLLERGCDSLYTQPELESRLRLAAREGRQLRVKLGMDPTAPDIHLGHSVVLRKMRQFQDLGHRAVLIIGDYTARVGDPSGVNKTRPVLSGEEIRDNARTYFEQAGRILDTSAGSLEIRYNSEWLEKLTFAQVLQLAGQMTVARMMERDTFEQRYKAGVPIGVHEFLYPLMQGYDSVCIQADVELGGTDQTFNNLVGRTLQENAGQPPQVVLIMPILVGLDGEMKMSKSKGNYIAITDEPNDMFGKVMSIPDALMDNYFTLLTSLPRAQIDQLVTQAHPRDAKARLGREIVAQYHGTDATEGAEAEFNRVFSQRQVPTDMPDISAPGSGALLVDVIIAAGFADSKSKARQLMQQGAVSLDDERITDIAAAPQFRTGQVLRVGKRRFGRIVTD